MKYLNPRLWQGAILCTIFGIVAFTPLMAEQPDNDPAALERSIKAAFLYKFTNYIEWPQNSLSKADRPITIAVMGDDQLAAALSALASARNANGSAVAVRKLTDINPDSTVQILFVGDDDKDRLSEVTASLDDRPILIVTESRGALSRGSVINFRLIDGHVRFEIALDAAQKRGLKLSSQLLAVAQSVQTGSH